MIRLHARLLPSSPVSKLSIFSVRRWRERWGWGGRGAESYDRKKAWASINRSILSEWFSHHLIREVQIRPLILLLAQKFLPAENIHNGFWIGRCYPGTAFVGIQKVLKSNSLRNLIIIFDTVPWFASVKVSCKVSVNKWKNLAKKVVDRNKKFDFCVVLKELPANRFYGIFLRL